MGEGVYENNNQNELTPNQEREFIEELNDVVETAATPVDSAKPHELKLPFLWPHEHLGKLISRRLTTESFSPNSLKDSLAWVKKSASKLVNVPTRNPAIAARLNGEGADLLSNKHDFIELERELGYVHHKNVLIKRGEHRSERKKIIEGVFEDPSQIVFLKPIGSGGGHGIKVTTVADAERYLSQANKDYVVQEAVDVDREYRYALFQDGENNWRIAYQKTRPRVFGDGNSTLLQLINQQDVPQLTKMATMFVNKVRLNKIVPKGESVQMMQVGFPKEGNFEKFIEDKEELANLDRFMARFIGDLEVKLGHRLPLTAFDIGFRDASCLKGEYNFDLIKENVVPFEYQVPFSTMIYYRNVPRGAQIFVNFHLLMAKQQFVNATPINQNKDQVGS